MSFYIAGSLLEGLGFFFPPRNKCLSEPFCPSFFCPGGKRFLLVLPLLLPAHLPFNTLELVLWETVTYNEFY